MLDQLKGIVERMRSGDHSSSEELAICADLLEKIIAEYSQSPHVSWDGQKFIAEWPNDRSTALITKQEFTYLVYGQNEALRVHKLWQETHGKTI